MTENKPGKTEALLIAQLNSGSETVILETIEHLRIAGNPLYIPPLIELLNQSSMEKVRKGILVFLSELKDPNARPYLIDAIDNKDYISIQKDLITICWQNGLDFSDYLSFFIDLVISKEFEVAFEAFTVIENLTRLHELENRTVETEKVEKAMETADELRIYLLRELRSMLTDI